MIKKLKRYGENIRFIINSMSPKNLIEVKIPNSESSGKQLLQTIKKLMFQSDLCLSDNPDFYSLYKVDIQSDLLTEQEKNALGIAIPYTCVESAMNTPKKNLWFMFFGTIATYMGEMAFFLSDGTDQEKHFYLNILSSPASDFIDSLNKILSVLNLPFFVSSSNPDYNTLVNRLNARLDSSIDFYVYNDADWTQNFYDNLGDNLSRTALLNFAKQRMYGKVFFDCDILYAITLTQKSGAQRLSRLRELKNAWPFMLSPTPESVSFMDLHTFIFEQYSIPGIAEVRTGDTVLDIGSGFGDTAIYFSQKIGNEGKIYACEPLPENISFIARNIALHQQHNIEILDCAFADSNQNTWIVKDSLATTTAAEVFMDEVAGAQQVKQITIDSFATDRKIDFIKADIEGAELAMLHGAKATIARDKPICALALYHRENDFRDLSKLLQSYNPDYVFYIRLDAEPMLFAVSK